MCFFWFYFGYLKIVFIYLFLYLLILLTMHFIFRLSTLLTLIFKLHSVLFRFM